MRRQGQRSGFTLVEAMVAGAILLLFCGGFFSAYIIAMRAQQNAIGYYRALCIARNRIQRARTLAFTSLPLLAETNVAVDAWGNPNMAGTYFRTTVVEVFTNTTADLARLTVRINYPMANSRLSSTPLEQTTLISNPM